MMWYWGSGVHWWGWVLGAAVTVAFWATVIWAVWYFATSFGRHPERPAGGRAGEDGDARRILDERLARGEIDAEQYRRLRDLIAGRDDRQPPAEPPASAPGGPQAA